MTKEPCWVWRNVTLGEDVKVFVAVPVDDIVGCGTTERWGVIELVIYVVWWEGCVLLRQVYGLIAVDISRVGVRTVGDD